MNEYQKKYQEQTIYQMSPAELLLLTYEEGIKCLKKAQYLLEGKKYETFDGNMDRATRIVRYLQQTLDMEQPVSGDLNRIYEYLLFDLSRVRAGRERRAEELPGMITILEELRDGFSGASKQASGTLPPRESRILV